MGVAAASADPIVVWGPPLSDLLWPALLCEPFCPSPTIGLILSPQLQGGGGGIGLVEGTAKLGKQLLGLEKKTLDPVQV